MTKTARLFVLVLSVVLAGVAFAQTAMSATVVTSRGYSRGEGAIEPTTTFSSADSHVRIVVELQNPSRTAGEIRVAFAAAGVTPGRGMALPIPDRSHYRTVARFRTPTAGHYRAVVRDSNGTELGATEFDVQ